MKKILFLTLLSAFTLIFAITSCSNNDYEETINAEMSKSRMTRAAYSITMEEVQERLRLIGEKYGTTINLLYLRDLSDITEETFLDIEHRIAARTNGINPTSNERQITQDVYTLNDDSSLNEISIASTNSNMEANGGVNEYWKFFQILYEHTAKHTYKFDYLIEIFCSIKNGHGVAEANFTDWTSITNASYCYNFRTSTVSMLPSTTSFFFDFLFYIPILRNSVMIEGSYNNGISLLYCSNSNVDIKLSF